MTISHSNKIETKKNLPPNQLKRSMRPRAGFFFFLMKINKIDKPLARFTKKKRERIQINKVRNEREEITTDTIVIQKFVTIL